MPPTRPTHRAPQGSDTPFSVLIASDWAPIRAFDTIIRTDPEAIYGDLLPTLRDADMRIVNCECALTKSNKPVWKSGAVFKGAPEHVAGLVAVPFDVACLGNNHVLDFGASGLRETLQVLHRNGIKTVGAGLTPDTAYAPLSVNVQGHTVHIVNISEGEDQTASRGGSGVFGWDIQRAVETIGRCKADGGVVIAIAHCGLEYVPYAPPYVVEAFRAMADAGADAVIGHHPHVPQGVEWRGRTPIIYSLGNFVFYQNTDLHYRKIGFFVTMRFKAGRVAHADLHPYAITDAGLRMLNEKESTAFHKMIVRLSKPHLTPTGHEKAWNAYLAYYGTDGFDVEVRGILNKMKTDPQKGAAMFRNRVTTMQHIELWRTFLTRMIDRPTQRGAPEAARIVTEYFSRR